MITAGPTLENIDPIRYISNYSSGKQGYEIAKQLVNRGAKVTLISGPTNIQSPQNVKLINVKTADEMLVMPIDLRYWTFLLFTGLFHIIVFIAGIKTIEQHE